ncbi:hypothetical protein AB0G73_18845 [Streptomyces sp. NPDC020719]|uniref:HNH endonuclease n=1 Tax=Streptomyces sp. NPDC020719 TaxID=3154896 RepID=UPI0033FBB773
MEEDVVNAAGEFEIAAAKAALHDLKDLKTNPTDQADRDELTNNYTDRLLKKSHPARDVYDALKGIAYKGICPLCGHRDVETLDHQLPKMKYPLLSVVPSNLVPACHKCNTIKSDADPGTAGEQTLHPYFDDLGTEQWLFAQLHEDSGAVTFFAAPPASWDSVLATRVRGHFETFGLADLYVAQAAREMSGLQYVLERKVQSTIGEYLRDEAEGIAKKYPNHWRTAMYQALAGSSWYIEGGYVLD